jgi:hypothetical protein
MRVSKRFVDRARAHLRKYQKAFENARTRDINESDTSVIVSDFLADILGYDKYSEVTTEFAVRSTFCDLAIKIDGRTQFLIEVKSIGTDLKDNHMRQATDYAANHGVDWVLLTNGPEWRAYKLRFEKPIQADEVFSVNILNPDLKAPQILEKLYLISKEAGGGGAMDSYYQQKEATSRYVIGQLLLADPVLSILRRELRRLYPAIRAREPELAQLLRDEVIKRDVIEGDRALAAERQVRRASRRRLRSLGAADSEAPRRSGEEAGAADTALREAEAPQATAM